MKLLLFLPLTAILLCSCENPNKDASSSADLSAEALANADEIAEKKAKIDALEREIESSKQIISDLEAAVLMERAKVEDNPDYDQSFLQETLNDQERERADIKEAEKELEQLQK